MVSSRSRYRRKGGAVRQSLQQWRAPPVLTPVLHVLSTIASSGGPTGQASLRWCARARTLQHRCRWLPLPICPPVRPPCPLLARPQPHASVLASTHDLPLAVRFRGSPDSRVGVVIATPPSKQRDPRVHACSASRTGGTARSAATLPHTAWLIGYVLTPSITPGGYVVHPAGCTRHRDACGAVIATPS